MCALLMVLPIMMWLVPVLLMVMWNMVVVGGDDVLVLLMVMLLTFGLLKEMTILVLMLLC